MKVETVHQADNYRVFAICVNKAGDIVFTKGSSACQIFDGEVTTLAGVCDQSGHTDGVGENARFSGKLFGLAVPDGSIVVSDTHNHCIRKIAPDGTTSTLAGAVGVRGFSAAKGPPQSSTNQMGSLSTEKAARMLLTTTTTGSGKSPPAVW
jgi:hypothetical protein